MNKVDYFTFLPPDYQIGEALNELKKVPQEKRKNFLDNVAKRILEHSNELKRLLEGELLEG